MPRDSYSYTPADYSREPASEEEGEAAWKEFECQAREYSLPEQLIQAYLSDRVSFQERQESIAESRRLWDECGFRDAIFEGKRTMLRIPGNPE